MGINRLTSLNFDLGMTAVAAVSYMTKWKDRYGITLGVQAFPAVTLVDRFARHIFGIDHSSKVPSSPFRGIMTAVFEEAIYSGILRSDNSSPQWWVRGMWGMGRFILNLVLQKTAARPYLSDKNGNADAYASLAGLIYAISREIVLYKRPSSDSDKVLAICDTVVFALIESAPYANKPEINSKAAWRYKVISGLFFRGTAMLLAKREGIVSAIALHMLFNFSRSLPEN